jgi:hypothetical protein
MNLLLLKKEYLVVGIILMMTFIIGFSCRLHGQEWSVSVAMESRVYTNSKVQINHPINLYNWSQQIAGSNQTLPSMDLKSRSLVGVLVKGTYTMQSSIILGAELLLQGINVNIFGQYPMRVLDREIVLLFVPRVGLGWSSTFPVSPDWEGYLNQHLKGATSLQREEGKVLFESLSPSSLGYPLSVNISPRVDLLYPTPFFGERMSLFGTVGFTYDLLGLIGSRSQSYFLISGGVFLDL